MRRTPEHAGVARCHAANEANFDENQPGPGNTGVAGFTVIVLDVSVVVELLTNGRLADSIRRDLAIAPA